MDCWSLRKTSEFQKRRGESYFLAPFSVIKKIPMLLEFSGENSVNCVFDITVFHLDFFLQNNYVHTRYCKTRYLRHKTKTYFNLRKTNAFIFFLSAIFWKADFFFSFFIFGHHYVENTTINEPKPRKTTFFKNELFFMSDKKLSYTIVWGS